MVGAARHLAVGVLHLRRRGRAHTTVGGLKLRGQLTQTVVAALDLARDVAGRRRVVTGDLEHIALAVVVHLDSPCRAIHPGPEGRHRVRDLPTDHVVRISMH